MKEWTQYQTELALEVVKPECEERRENTREQDFWSQNTTASDVEQAWKRKGQPS